MKAILTVTGKDKAGIIAKVSTFLADNSVNIEDISQTVMGEYFTMIMVLSLNACPVPLASLVAGTDKIAKELGLDISLKHEDIYNAMYNV